MSVSWHIAITPHGQDVLRQHAVRGAMLHQMVGTAFKMGLAETAAKLKKDLLRGGRPGDSARAGGLPLAVRSGHLLQSVDFKLLSEFEGLVGSFAGPASAYAKVHLGDEDWTLTPRSARNLWIPIRDNVGPSGQMRMSPREAMSLMDSHGKRRLRFFKGRSGRLLAFLPDVDGGVHKGGKRKGLPRGKFLFVLKPEVTVRGTNALAIAIEMMRDRFIYLLETACNNALGMGGGAING